MNKRFILLLITTIFFIHGCNKKQKDNSTLNNIENIKLNPGRLKIDIQKSNIVWIGKKISTKEHQGTLDLKEGHIGINEEGSIEGEIIIDMLTINTTDIQGRGKESLDGHLKSSDFFDVENHPDAVIKFHGNEAQFSNNKLNLNGNLTIKNITHPISFEAELQQTDNNITANAMISFDRSKYNVRYGSGKFFENLGDNLILDEISVNVLIVANWYVFN